MDVPVKGDGSYRDLYPVTKSWAFLNHAAVAPLSLPAKSAINEWAQDITENGDVNEGGWWRRVEAIRRQAARLVGASADEIAFLKNTSEGIALVAEGFPWNPGDNVVLAEGEYPANVYPWMHLRDKGVEARVVPLRGGVVAVDELLAAVDARTRLVTLSFVQFATGYRADVGRLGAELHRRGVDFFVDAIQGLGVFAIDVDAMKIDYLCADGHKWLTGPEGCAIFYICKNKIEKIRPNSVGWKSVVGMLDYSRIDFRLLASAGRYEGGSYNMPGILGLGANIDLFLDIGVGVMNERVRQNTEDLVDRLRQLGASVISDRSADHWSGIVSFDVPGVEPQIALKALRERGVVVAARGGHLRASPHFYNNTSDTLRLIDGLRDLRGHAS